MIWMLNHLSLSFFSEREELSQRRTSIAVLCGCGPNAQIVQHSAENPTSARCLNSAHSCIYRVQMTRSLRCLSGEPTTFFEQARDPEGSLELYSGNSKGYILQPSTGETWKIQASP